MTVIDVARLGAPYRRQLVLLASLAVASAMVTLGIPWLAGQLLGSVVSGSATADAQVVALLIAALLVSAIVSFISASGSAVIAARILAELRQRAYEHVQRLPLAYHHANAKGDVLALMTYEIGRLSDFLAGTLIGIPAKLLTSVGAVILMYRINPRLALVVPLLIPAFYLILKIVGRRLRRLALALQQREAELVAEAQEMLEILPAIKAFTREDAQAARYRGVVEECARLRVREGRITAALEPAVGLVAALAAVLVLVLAGRSVEAGQMTSTQLFSFIFYAALLSRPVSALAHVYGQTQTAIGTLARLQSVFGQAIEPPGERTATTRALGRIAFEDVFFGFPNRGSVLVGLSLVIEAGTTVALVGPNGVGKTALINLLMRYYEPQRGRVLLDSVDIQALGVEALRRQIGLVPQSPLLFNGTIRDNIAFGADAASEAQVIAAAGLAQATAFIDALPRGMDTVIGDGGVRLSGGQRQRIALARALIEDPPVLIFDEATSMFDDEGETAFIAESAAALRGRTVILVTHRPATLALASRVITLEAGAVREDALAAAATAATAGAA